MFKPNDDSKGVKTTDKTSGIIGPRPGRCPRCGKRLIFGKCYYSRCPRIYQDLKKRLPDYVN